MIGPVLAVLLLNCPANSPEARLVRLYETPTQVIHYCDSPKQSVEYYDDQYRPQRIYSSKFLIVCTGLHAEGAPNGTMECRKTRQASHYYNGLMNYGSVYITDWGFNGKDWNNALEGVSVTIGNTWKDQP